MLGHKLFLWNRPSRSGKVGIHVRCLVATRIILWTDEDQALLVFSA